MNGLRQITCIDATDDQRPITVDGLCRLMRAIISRARKDAQGRYRVSEAHRVEAEKFLREIAADWGQG